MVHRESRTFDRRRLATEWATRLECQLSKPNTLPKRNQLALTGPLHEILLKYRKEVSEIRPMGRSKSGGGPATVNNDLVILRYARAAWNVSVDLSVIDDAYEVLRAEKLVAKSKVRSRRPSQSEHSRLTEYFLDNEKRRSSLPMSDIMLFAVHSARRQSEITSLLAGDNDEETRTGIVRNLKHPSDRELFRRFKYTDEAWEIVSRQEHSSDRIFPSDPKTIGAAFTRACRVLEIEDLHFHDLRHEATSRLFETGYSFVGLGDHTSSPPGAPQAPAFFSETMVHSLK